MKYLTKSIDIINNLPKVEGEYILDYSLKNISFFKVGGKCDVLFIPKNENDLIHFLKNKPQSLKVTVLGSLSNTLVLDSGIRGVVIILNNLKSIEFYENTAKVESGAILADFIKKCVNNGISSCEKLYCIPGTIGGAIYMNAGIPDFEISDSLISIDILDLNGNKSTINKNDLKMEYRKGNIPKDTIIISSIFKIKKSNKIDLENELKNIRKKRFNSQPFGQNTCGSTFKNPNGLKAWELIKKSTADKLFVKNVKVSDIHCNFIINTGKSKAKDIRDLIDKIKAKVYSCTNILLEEEIITIGEE